MFDSVRNNPRIVQIFLALITIPFALFGVDAYFSSTRGSPDSVAKVGSLSISSQELDLAVRQQESSLRAQLGESFDKAMVESPEFRAAVLERLINDRALIATIQESRLQVPDQMVQQFIKALPQFQENGQFSLRLYEAIVRNQGLTNRGFEEKVRASLAQQLMLVPVVESAAAPRAVAERWLDLLGEERTVSTWLLDARGFVPQVKLAPDAARKFYDANQARFQVPEQARLEYVMFSAQSLGSQGEVTEADLRKWYDEHADLFRSAEERRARHILVQVEQGASAAAKQAARKKVEQLLVTLKADPEKFAALARTSSDDKMSATQGGDLGFFAKGAMVKAFEDAAFSLKPNEISGVVESEFGFHIIQVTELKPAKQRSFDEVRAEITGEVKQQLASKRFSELADQFSNLVYEQPDALKPIADKLGLKLQQSDWIRRGVKTGTELDSPKIAAAVFSSDAIKGRRNTEAIDLGDGRIFAARVLDYKPATVKAFDDVKAEVENIVTMQEAAKLAAAAGANQLAKLGSGTSPEAAWSAAKVVRRASPDLDEAARKAVFGASAKALPAYAGVTRPDGYVIYRIEKVVMQKLPDHDAKLDEVHQQYAKALGQEDVRAFVAMARERLGVKIQPRAGEGKGKS